MELPEVTRRFAWGPEFVTGLAMVDDQHRELVHLINAFGDLVTQDACADGRAMAAILADLADYADYHFQQEEAVFGAVGIDARHSQQHRSEHADFLEEVQRRQSKQNAVDPVTAQSLDMQMPILDGLSATREIRQLPNHADTPIIAMTANAFA